MWNPPGPASYCSWFRRAGSRLRWRLPRSRAATPRRSGCEGRLSRGQARDRNPERTATDVIETEPMTEFYARGFAAVFAANPQLNVGPSLAAEVASDFH